MHEPDGRTRGLIAKILYGACMYELRSSPTDLTTESAEACVVQHDANHRQFNSNKLTYLFRD